MKLEATPLGGTSDQDNTRRNFGRELLTLARIKPKIGIMLLVEFYNQKLCVYAHSLINDKDIAEDIVQNVFIKVWEKRRNLRPDFSIKSFLYRSVYNEFIDQNRKRQSVTALEKKYIEALDTVTEENTDVLEKLMVMVQQEIQNLPPKCKKVFLLSKEEGLSNIEIAERLDVSIKTIEYHIAKAFNIMRKNLEDKDPLGQFLFILFGHKNVKSLFSQLKR